MAGSLVLFVGFDAWPVWFCLLTCLTARSCLCLFVCSFVRSFVRSFVCFFAYSMFGVVGCLSVSWSAFCVSGRSIWGFFLVSWLIFTSVGWLYGFDGWSDRSFVSCFLCWLVWLGLNRAVRGLSVGWFNVGRLVTGLCVGLLALRLGPATISKLRRV